MLQKYVSIELKIDMQKLCKKQFGEKTNNVKSFLI